jgi:hypothetical protein
MIKNMKLVAFSIAVLCVLHAWGQDQRAQPLTNDVPITSYGIRFGLGDNFWDAPNLEAMYERTDLMADQPLTWYLRETLQSSSVVFIGMSNSFAFDLKTRAGISIPKTAKGRAMSAGPASLTSLRGNRLVRRRGTGFSDFPRLTELFEIPSNGVYWLEIRYWTWNSNKFSLSNPVRLRVIKEASTNDVPAAVSTTNAPGTNR